MVRQEVGPQRTRVIKSCTASDFQPLSQQIEVIELLSGKPVAAVVVNHENLSREQIPLVCDAIQQVAGLPAVDVLYNGADQLVKALRPYLEKFKYEK